MTECIEAPKFMIEAQAELFVSSMLANYPDIDRKILSASVTIDVLIDSRTMVECLITPGTYHNSRYAKCLPMPGDNPNFPEWN